VEMPIEDVGTQMLRRNVRLRLLRERGYPVAGRWSGPYPHPDDAGRSIYRFDLRCTSCGCTKQWVALEEGLKKPEDWQAGERQGLTQGAGLPACWDLMRLMSPDPPGLESQVDEEVRLGPSVR
jgi:hypothetical protein